MIHLFSATLLSLALQHPQPTPVHSVGACPGGTYPEIVGTEQGVIHDGNIIIPTREAIIVCVPKVHS